MAADRGTNRETETMKFRQVEDKTDGTVKRDDLKPGDKVEIYGAPHAVAAPGQSHFAWCMEGMGGGDFVAPVYRIRITGQDDSGKLTWDRVPTGLTPVRWEELEHNDLFASSSGLLVRRYKPGGYGLNFDGEDVHTMGFDGCYTYSGDSTLDPPFYRAEICGFEPGDDGGTLLWRRI